VSACWHDPVVDGLPQRIVERNGAWQATSLAAVNSFGWLTRFEVLLACCQRLSPDPSAAVVSQECSPSSVLQDALVQASYSSPTLASYPYGRLVKAFGDPYNYSHCTVQRQPSYSRTRTLQTRGPDSAAVATRESDAQLLSVHDHSEALAREYVRLVCASRQRSEVFADQHMLSVYGLQSNPSGRCHFSDRTHSEHAATSTVPQQSNDRTRTGVDRRAERIRVQEATARVFHRDTYRNNVETMALSGPKRPAMCAPSFWPRNLYPCTLLIATALDASAAFMCTVTSMHVFCHSHQPAMPHHCWRRPWCTFGTSS
jgi:hypothetical protein